MLLILFRSMLTKNVRDHIKSLNFGYKVDMRENGVQYFNELAAFIDPHTIEGVNKNGEKVNLTILFFLELIERLRRRRGRRKTLLLPSVGGQRCIQISLVLLETVSRFLISLIYFQESRT